MKNTVLLSLLIVLMLSFGCSSNDDDNESIETQTFLEKYDGVVWLEDSTDSVDDYAYLIQFLNSSKSIVDNEMSDGGINGPSNCDTETISYITVNKDDILVRSFGTGTLTYTVTNSGEDLKIETVDTDPSDPSEQIFYYSRSNYSMDCN
tara:strand:- start:241 stop:687 length:447 start_codon:yes stop_codon:yes gene_type:complete